MNVIATSRFQKLLLFSICGLFYSRYVRKLSKNRFVQNVFQWIQWNISFRYNVRLYLVETNVVVQNDFLFLGPIKKICFQLGDRVLIIMQILNIQYKYVIVVWWVFCDFDDNLLFKLYPSFRHYSSLCCFARFYIWFLFYTIISTSVFSYR